MHTGTKYQESIPDKKHIGTLDAEVSSLTYELINLMCFTSNAASNTDMLFHENLTVENEPKATNFANEIDVAKYKSHRRKLGDILRCFMKNCIVEHEPKDM